MQTWDSLARVSLESTIDSKKARYATAPSPTPAAGALDGHAQRGPMRLVLYNHTSIDWTNCKVQFPDRASFTTDKVPAHDEEPIMLAKFKYGADDDWVRAKCKEGEGKFWFVKGTSEGTLTGRATRNVFGRIIVYNGADKPWSACTLSLPDGRGYFLNYLAANSDDGIMSQKFAGPPPTEVAVKCNQGSATFRLRHE
jgi:hypothetical protein